MNDEPRWRRDFPVDWPEDEYISRRDFVRFLGLTSLAFVAGQFWILVESARGRGRAALPEREIARVSGVPVGGSLVFDYPGPHEPKILVRTQDGTFIAYDQQCTHLACPVIPAVAEGVLRCPCHHGLFDLATGRPLAGPPRRPLPRVRLRIDGDRIYAIGIEARTT